MYKYYNETSACMSGLVNIFQLHCLVNGFGEVFFFMKKNKALLWELFTSTFMLSAFTFGGGYVIVPLMEKKFVDELNWIDEEEMLDLVSIAQSAPGSLSVHAAVLIGYRMAGFLGALVSSIGTILPPFVIMTVVSYVYMAIRDNWIVNNLLLGMQAAVAAIIINVVFSMGSRIVKQKKLIPNLMLAFCLISVIFFDMNIVLLLIIAGTVGALTTILDDKKSAKKRKEADK